MRISRPDTEDPTGKKRRHFEISIDSPFNILDCRATHVNTHLPAYAGEPRQGTTYHSTCGCPDATKVATTNTSPSSSTGTLSGLDSDLLPAPPQAAHVHTDGHMNPATESPTRATASTDENGITTAARPMHLLRTPSYNPPAFDDDSAPPPAMELIDHSDPFDLPVATPPPQYDVVVGTPSVDGLADYFTRLADYGYDNEEEDSSDSDGSVTPSRILERSGRVNVAHPRTPGGRMPSRSFELTRPPLSLNMDALASRSRPVVS